MSLLESKEPIFCFCSAKINYKLGIWLMQINCQKVAKSASSQKLRLKTLFWYQKHFETTVKPVYNGHPWDPKKVALI